MIEKKEIRITNDITGGQKGQKLERFDLIPVRPLTQLAELYGRGASKYPERNWEKSYDWNLSYAALQRHANAFWSGEDHIPLDDEDPTSGTHHLICVAWHSFALIEWSYTHPELDNRVSYKDKAF